MSILNCVLDNKPSYWQRGGNNYEGRFIVSVYSQEFDEVRDAIENAQQQEQPIYQIERVQNVTSYGQFLFRKQHLLAENNSTYYVVRKFIKIKNHVLADALRYNLDYRRLDLSDLVLYNSFSYVCDDDVVLVVSAVTDNYVGSFTPSRSNEYYIDYIVTFE